MITAYIVNKNGSHSIKNIENNLETYYSIIDCDTIDIVSRRFAGRYLDVICDDCGLLTDNPVATAVDTGYHPMLVGTLIIVRHNEEGETISLTEEDLKAIRKSVAMVLDERGLRAILRCDY